MYEIEKNIEIPKPKFYRRGCGRPPKYPLGKMEVGDSFSISFQNEKLAQSFRTVVCQFGRRNEKKFVVRHINDTEYRCWRKE